MIWLWITAALILSYLPLINKKIDLAHYMWLLIPIDAYGISIAGAVVKPYMVFALMLPIILYARNKGTDFDLSASKGQLLAGVISILIIVVNVVNNNDNAYTVKAALMTFVVYICAQLYASCTDNQNNEQLSDMFIASCFGYGIVYFVAYLCLMSNINIGGLIANERSQDGLFMLLSNMNHGQYVQVYRLRGFAFDPNTMFVQFIFGICACVSRLSKKFSFYYIFTFIISIVCILLSSSRMGLLCCVISIIITALVNTSQVKNVKKKIFSIIGMLVICASLLIAAITRWGQSVLSSLLSTYQNRSSLTDEYGRFSIWKECLGIYWDNNPMLGVGLGQMDRYTMTERMTHNTWLQFICECGLIVGGITVAYFFTVMIIGWAKTRFQHRLDPDNTSYLSLVIGYTVTIISLLSVDNITCSYLWFGALLLLKTANYVPQKTQNIKLKTHQESS